MRRWFAILLTAYVLALCALSCVYAPRTSARCAGECTFVPDALLDTSQVVDMR